MLKQNYLAVPFPEPVAAIQYVMRNPGENWLAKERKYPVIDGRYYCPQCLYDSSRKPQTFGEPFPKSYSRGRDVRRHWKHKHGETGYLVFL
jgi:hypothetical protein